MDACLFTQKVYNILEDESLSEIISWREGGMAFSIDNRSKFTEEVLPKHFRHKNLAIFIRQLNIYGFHKSRDSDLFSHPSFIRGRPEELKKIEKKIKKEKRIKKSDMPAFIKQLYKAHKQNKKSETFIKKLEKMVFTLENQNSKLISLITDSRERSLKLESMLISVMDVLRHKEKPFRKIFEQDGLHTIRESSEQPIYNPLNFNDSDTEDIYQLIGN